MRNIFFVALLGVLTGCSGNVALKGKVVFSDDKSPVPVGTVSFEKGAFSARGELKSDGTFTVGSLKTNDGLPAGTYQVAITNAVKFLGDGAQNTGNTGVRRVGDVVEKGGIEAPAIVAVEPLIDEKYANVGTSGITIDVTRSKKYIEIEVDRYQPKAGR